MTSANENTVKNLAPIAAILDLLSTKNIDARNMSKGEAGQWMSKLVNNGYRPVPVPVPLQLHPDTSEWA